MARVRPKNAPETRFGDMPRLRSRERPRLWAAKDAGVHLCSVRTLKAWVKNGVSALL